MLKSVIFALHVLAIAAQSNSEIQNDVHKTSVNNPWHYTFVTTQKLSWNDSFQACKRLNAMLASVDSTEEMLYLQKVVTEIGSGQNFTRLDSYWVAGSDIDTEGKWIWMSNGQAISNVNLWAAGQPDNKNGSQHCTCLWPFQDWLLDDNICQSSFNYICKRSVNDECEK